MRPQEEQPKRLLTFTSGGWVLWLTGVLLLALLAWAVGPAIIGTANRGPGDGENPESYGFDLSYTLVEEGEIVAGYFYKDVVRAMVMPEHFPGAKMQLHDDKYRGKYLVHDDLVIGVTINGESRCYPMMVMNVHECINDELGGVPIAVTYSHLSHSVAVFDRRVGDDTLEFGVSGLLLNHNVLLYDRHEDPADESLWSQLQARAVTGQAAKAEATLNTLACTMSTWADWYARHPKTTVIARDPGLIRHYQKMSRDAYLRSPDLMEKFPLARRPSGSSMPLKERVVAVSSPSDPRPSAAKVFAQSDIAQRVNADGVWTTTIDGTEVEFRYHADPAYVVVSSSAPINVWYAFWFAWYAQHPEAILEQSAG